jgi:hypothetical protein
MNGGMVQEIAASGLERDELAKAFGGALIGGQRIPYEPKELAGIITLLRAYNPQRYLAIEGMTDGGWKYIGKACAIPHVQPVGKEDTRKQLRDKDIKPFDLVSIDPRGLPVTASEVWKYLQGGKEQRHEFGRGAPVDYGPAKIKAGTILIFNLTDPETKALYFDKRTLDNKLHQSTFAGMIRWTT